MSTVCQKLFAIPEECVRGPRVQFVFVCSPQAKTETFDLEPFASFLNYDARHGRKLCVHVIPKASRALKTKEGLALLRDWSEIRPPQIPLPD